uniref:Mitochondrial translational release factor 1 like n=1 Tax=Pelusios castaneus TaxID=367368 RepID=A0A8C8SBA5_9SAUR
MRLLQRTVSAARRLCAAPSPTTCCRRGAVAEHGRSGTFAPQQPRRPLSSRTGLEAVFADPGMRRYLEEQAGGGASPQLAARIHQLWAKEQELRDTQELARAGGLRYAAASIVGLEAYKHMKFESGVHRVQRVPKTEKQNRIHTSTMTIAIFPQPKEINLTIHRKDLQIETKRSSGAGGQHVNKTDSAVRITHIPTGVVAECQQERSQIRNKEKAMQILRARIYNIKLEEETRKRENARNLQIGTKGRSEKIRTYNFTQDRVTDHRINRTVHHIENFMLGKELLDEMIISLRKYADYESLMEIISENEKKN